MRYLFLLILLAQQAYGQSRVGQVQTFPIPDIHSVFYDLEILDSSYTLVPIDGGLFCPEQQCWFVPPGQRLINAVSFFRPSNVMNYSVLDSKSSYIISIWPDGLQKVRKDSFQTVYNGIFFCKQLDADTLLYGGMTGGHFSIFTYSNKKNTRLFGFDNRIDGIQFINSHSFYFQVKNNIYLFTKGHSPKIIYSSQYMIYGFCVDSKGNLYISRKQGIFKYMNNSVTLVLPFVTGILRLSGNTLYILSFTDKVMTKLAL